MEPLIKLTGIVAALDRQIVDTDQIIPAVHLKRFERTGFGQFLFSQPGWRFLPNGDPDPEFELNKPSYQGASILVAGHNFGSGSSREHAPWALLDYGFRVLIAPSFADIFYNNCFQNGMLPIVLSEENIQNLTEKAQKDPEGYEATIDLENCTISDNYGLKGSFEVDQFRRDYLLTGLEDIGITLQNENKITEFEKSNQ